MSDDGSKFKKISWDISIMYSMRNFQWQRCKAVQIVSSNGDRFRWDKLERIAETFSWSEELFTLGQYLCGDVHMCRHINTPAVMAERYMSRFEAAARTVGNRGMMSWSSVNRTWLEARQTSLKFDVRGIGKCGEFVVACSLVNRARSQSGALLLLGYAIQSGL